jgi:membrane-associated phospholipid phosphatase
MTTSNSTNNVSERRNGTRRALALGAVAVGATVGFGLLNAAVVRRETAAVDEAVRKRAKAPRGHPAREAAAKAAPIGKWWTYIPGALGASAYLLAARGEDDERAGRSRTVGAGAVLLASTIATVLNGKFDELLPQPPAPPGHPRGKPVCPSGHAFGPGAIAFSAGYVMAREGLARPAVAAPVALAVPLTLAGTRMMVEKHWASDVLGGWLAGAAVAAACLAGYEAASGR